MSRPIWIAKTWIGAVAVVPALGAALLGPEGIALVVVALGIEAWAIAATAAQIRAMEASNTGEMLFVDGSRVPLALLNRVRTAEKAELVVGAVGIAILVVYATTWSLAHAALCGALGALVALAKRASWRSTEAVAALHEHRIDDALAIIEPMIASRFAASAMGIYGVALVQAGRASEGTRVMEDYWTGGLDAGAVGVAVARLHRGNRKLADQVLVEFEPTNLYQRYVHELLRGHVALLDGSDTPIDPLLIEALPPAMHDELQLLDAALAKRQGDDSRAAKQLAKVDPAHQGWRAAHQPLLWEALYGSVPAQQNPQTAAATTSPFAPPSERAQPRRALLGVGALPFERAIIGVHHRPWLDRLLRGLAILLLVLCLPLGLIETALWVSGRPLDLVMDAIVVVGILTASAIFVRLRIKTVLHSERGIVTSDGQILRPDRPGLWLWTSVVPIILAIPMLLGVVVAAEVLSLSTTYTVVPRVLFAVLMVHAIRIRVRTLRLLHAVHHGPPEDALVHAAKAPRTALGWSVIAHLLNGDPDAARVLAQTAVAYVADVRELTQWILAAGGDRSLDDILAQRPIDEPGPRFRWEVAVRLAALHEGRPRAVRDRIDEAWVLPNRVGAALAVLDHAVLQQCDPQEAAAYAKRQAVALEEGRWVWACWPELQPSSP